MGSTVNEATNERPPQVAMSTICPLEIAIDVDVRDKEQALKVAAYLVNRAVGLDQELVFRALSRREQAGSTALGCGIAIPHARIAGIQRPLTVFLRPRYPLPFDAPDGKPVSDVLVIMVPADGSPEEHLRLLAHVANIFADPEFREKIAVAGDPEDIRATFMQCMGASRRRARGAVRNLQQARQAARKAG